MVHGETHLVPSGTVGHSLAHSLEQSVTTPDTERPDADAFLDNDAPDDAVAQPAPAPVPDAFTGKAPELSLRRPTFANVWIWSAWLAGVVLATMEGPSVGSVGLIVIAVVGMFLVYSRSRPASTVRRLVIRLPVIREPEALRIGALAGIADATCARCESFDHEAGQRMLDANPMFRQAAGHLSPSQMQKTKAGAWNASNGFDERGQPKDTQPELLWSGLGVCKKQNKGVFAPQSCPRWS